MEGSRPAMATNSDDESQVNWEVFLKVCAVFLAALEQVVAMGAAMAFKVLEP